MMMLCVRECGELCGNRLHGMTRWLRMVLQTNNTSSSCHHHTRPPANIILHHTTVTIQNSHPPPPPTLLRRPLTIPLPPLRRSSRRRVRSNIPSLSSRRLWEETRGGWHVRRVECRMIGIRIRCLCNGRVSLWVCVWHGMAWRARKKGLGVGDRSTYGCREPAGMCFGNGA
jgi:hypothetical protein